MNLTGKKSLTRDTGSLWDETKTFFPLFLHRLSKAPVDLGPICIVGAADGKFVIPLASLGWRVIAIEANKTALFGGNVEFPKGSIRTAPGLIDRLQDGHLQHLVDIRYGDFTEMELGEACPAVFTSCSWHYSRNHRVPIAEFVEAMKRLVMPGGIFCAEYMMPTEQRHFGIPHYLRETELAAMFDGTWSILEDFYTSLFPERAHVEVPYDHFHRMGFMIARREDVTR